MARMSCASPAFPAREADNSAGSDDVMDADHVAHCAAYRLRGFNDRRGKMLSNGHAPLEFGEHEVGNRPNW